jgi:hypothetical protein
MDRRERAARLRAMLAQIAAPGGEIESVVTTKSGAPVELDALEAIVMPQNRPVVFARGDSYDRVEKPWTSLNEANVKARISAFLPMIGRIEVPNSILLPYAGTGEVVALHFAGEYLKGNYAVPTYELARDARVAPKLNFQGSLGPTNDWEPAWRQVDGMEDAPMTPAAPVLQKDSSVPRAIRTGDDIVL